MPLDQKDLEQVTDALSSKFDEMKQKNDKELEAVKSEITGKAKEIAEEVKGLQSLKDEIDESLKKGARPGNNNDANVEEHKNAFYDFIKTGNEDGLIELQQKSLSTVVDADGGFAVPENLDREIVSTLRDENVMRQACRVITVGTPEYKKLVNTHGAASGWVGETDPRPGTNTPKLEEVKPIWGEIYANPQATKTMLEDVFFNAESWLNQELVEEFAEQEEAAFTIGDGTKKPKGLFAHTMTTEADDARAFGSLQKKLTGASGKITADDIKTFQFMLRKKYRKGASYMGNGNTLAELMLLKDAQGNYLWRPGLEEGTPALLCGYKYLENEAMPDMVAGANALSFGNFQRAYYILDRMGTSVLRDPFTNKPFVGFYTTKRVGGMLVDSNAVKVLEVAA